MPDIPPAGSPVRRGRGRRRAWAGPPAPATAEDFAVLVADLRAELAAAGGERRRELLTGSETPQSFTDRPWTAQSAGPKAAAVMTGYSDATIRGYKARAAREHAAGTATARTMPAPGNGDWARPQWAVGDLALWVATRNEGQARDIIVGDETAAKILADVEAGRLASPTGKLPWGARKAIARQYGVNDDLVAKLAGGEVAGQGRTGAVGGRLQRRDAELLPEATRATAAVAAREGSVSYLALAEEMGVDYRTASSLARELAADETVSAQLAGLLAETQRYQSWPILLGKVQEAGIPATERQVRRLLPDLRAAETHRARYPSSRVRGGSVHPSGYLCARELAEDWEVSDHVIMGARKRGELKVAERSYGRVWYDPKRLRARKDRRRGPVDVGHPVARLEPGDEGYGK